MTTIASQITSLTSVYSTVYSDAHQRKHQSSASLAFVWGIHRDRWIPRTKGQLRGKCFHLMTSSCILWMPPRCPFFIQIRKYVSLDVIIFMVVWELTPKFQSSASTICQNVHWYTKADGDGNLSVFDMNGVAVMACLLWLVIRNRWTMKRHLFAHRCDYGVDTVFECMLRKGSTADFRFFNIYHS